MAEGPLTAKDLAAWPRPEAQLRMTARDRVNRIRLHAKFLWVPFRLYYRWRSWKYALFRTPELGLVRHLCDPKRVSLDVGANFGLFSHLMSGCSDAVYAFEPNPIPFDVLRRVADANVVPVPMALSDAAGEIGFLMTRGKRGWTTNGGHIAGDAVPHGAVPITVATRRIDDLDVGPIGFVKVDVEGHEIAVLDGGAATIARDRPYVMLENETFRSPERARAVFDRMRDLDYRGFFLDAGRLRGLEAFDAARHQADPTAAYGFDPDYVKNFIFLPKEG